MKSIGRRAPPGRCDQGYQQLELDMHRLGGENEETGKVAAAMVTR
jgi:hypothetical protein